MARHSVAAFGIERYGVIFELFFGKSSVFDYHCRRNVGRRNFVVARPTVGNDGYNERIAIRNGKRLFVCMFGADRYEFDVVRLVLGRKLRTEHNGGARARGVIETERYLSWRVERHCERRFRASAGEQTRLYTDLVVLALQSLFHGERDRTVIVFRLGEIGRVVLRIDHIEPLAHAVVTAGIAGGAAHEIVRIGYGRVGNIDYNVVLVAFLVFFDDQVGYLDGNHAYVCRRYIGKLTDVYTERV